MLSFAWRHLHSWHKSPCMRACIGFCVISRESVISWVRLLSFVTVCIKCEILCICRNVDRHTKKCRPVKIFKEKELNKYERKMKIAGKQWQAIVDLVIMTVRWTCTHKKMRLNSGWEAYPMPSGHGVDFFYVGQWAVSAVNICNNVADKSRTTWKIFVYI